MVSSHLTTLPNAAYTGARATVNVLFQSLDYFLGLKGSLSTNWNHEKDCGYKLINFSSGLLV
jgi:hypothetical protein